MSRKQSDKSRYSFGKFFANAALIFTVALTASAATSYIYNVNSKELAIAASINGVSVGCVESYSDMANAAAKLDAIVSDATEGKYAANTVVSFDYIHTDKPVYLTEDECFNILWSQVEKDFCTAYMLYVDDRQAAAHEDEAELNKLIESIEANLLAAVPEGFNNVQISSRLRIEKQLCLKSSVKTIGEIDALLNPLSVGRGAEDDSIVTARVAALEAASPMTAQASDSGSLKLDYNYINTITVTETIPYETERIENPDMFIGTEAILTKGVDGAKDVTYEFVYDNYGRFLGKSIVSATIVTEAVTEVITVGTAEIPEAVPTGVILWPCERPKGVSSGYGWRDLYGRPDFHLGIDIPDVRGSAIWAADGGTVTFAGTTPSYGKNVMIEHSNGFSTLYAHLDTINVNVGDKLYQGQNIGTMGSTGVAYGTHLHFEVRINNKTVDPMNHLPKE